jgi:hypothetical protein
MFCPYCDYFITDWLVMAINFNSATGTKFFFVRRTPHYSWRLVFKFDHIFPYITQGADMVTLHERTVPFNQASAWFWPWADRQRAADWPGIPGWCCPGSGVKSHPSTELGTACLALPPVLSQHRVLFRVPLSTAFDLSTLLLAPSLKGLFYPVE